MIRCRFAACARLAIMDVQTNHLSMISILDDMTVPTIPGIVPSMSVAFILEREPNDLGRIDGVLVVSANGKEVNRFPVDINFQDTLRTRAIIHIAGVPIMAPGTLEFQLQEPGGQLLGHWEVVITTPNVHQVVTPPHSS